MKRIAVLLVALLWLASARAAPPPDTSACDTEQSQTDLNICAGTQLANADADLNAAWRQVMARLAGQPLAIAKLKAAQRLWIQLRDADMDAQFPLAEDEDPRIQYGSIYPMEFALAKARLTRERTRYLRENWLTDSNH